MYEREGFEVFTVLVDQRSHRRSLVALLHSAEVPYAVRSYLRIVTDALRLFAYMLLLLQSRLPRLPVVLLLCFVKQGKAQVQEVYVREGFRVFTVLMDQRSRRRSLVALVHSAEVPYAVRSYLRIVTGDALRLFAYMLLLLQSRLPRLPVVLLLCFVKQGKAQAKGKKLKL